MRALGSRYNNHLVDEENPYWISFSDIMAGLLVIFMLAVVALILELTQKSQEWDEVIEEIVKAEQVRNDLLYDIVKELNDKNIPVYLSENATVLRVPEDALSFESGKYRFEKESQTETAIVIAKVIYQAIIKGDRQKYLDTIFIEGHTDDSPYNREAIKGNWGLSTFRAIELWETWEEFIDQENRLVELENSMGKKLFSVSGYADTRPAKCTNSDGAINNPVICPDGPLSDSLSKKKNRRIDIRFTVKHPTLRELEDMKKSKDL